ncbi:MULTISPECIES: DUF916 domain-containing protein [unclassified Micromonospora]|uniref:DUF916 domain-containing protein n=1 Tax=unclassified Micromonospora TaxID=2617518 RepID=UPI001C5D5173|nr:DUF916 domain-containing protein [Micromonospora sp. RL09-050-HVF-A]MBW4701716.1 hypothetical protein [Micromonospora sp. RL09-050-HVF-A]
MILAVTVLVAAGTPAIAASPSPQPSPSFSGPAAAVGIRLLDAPVNRRDDSRAHKYIVDHVHPGTTIRRRIVVENVSEVERKIAVYAAAAEIDRTGFVFAPDRTPNELSSWITVDRDEVELEPDDEAVLTVTITVPKKASAGERYAVIWAEVSTTDGANVRNIGRAGIRVYLSVGPGGEPPSGFEVSGLTGDRDGDGAPVVTAEVRNTGQRALDLAGQLRLTDGPGGLSVGPVRAEADTLALGATTTVRVVLDPRLPDGPWAARLDLASGWTKRTATGTVSFGGPTAAAATSTDRSGLVLTGGFVASAVVLLLFTGYVFRRRGRSRQALPA